MNLKFRVEWCRLFKALTIFMSLSIFMPVLIILLVKVAKNGFSYTKAFPRTTPLLILCIFLGILIISGLTALVISLSMRLVSITVTKNEIFGRNSWGLKNRIPLNDVVALKTFKSNGINGILVCSKLSGKVFISEYTENFDDLVALLRTYVPNQNP